MLNSDPRRNRMENWLGSENYPDRYCLFNNPPPPLPPPPHKKTVQALRNKNPHTFLFSKSGICYFQTDDYDFYAMDSTNYRNNRVGSASLTILETGSTSDPWLSQIEVESDYRRQGIGTNIIRAINKSLSQKYRKDNLLLIPASGQSGITRFYLSEEGAALINSCTRKGLILHEQCMQEIPPISPPNSPG